ncbi:MAG: DUF115 domain-containing protein [Syntrophaceae bacterium]|nr:DUF115 domain-containing protein [Syntrophaceae bacterium]
MNGHLDANLAALRERCPAFLTWWEECPSQPGEYQLLSSMSGLPDLEIERPGGWRIILYNRENPFEAMREELADRSFPKGSLTFLFGLGLGYRALHILSIMETGHAVFIVERDPDILRLALTLHDYSAEIRKGILIFAVPEQQALRRVIHEKNGVLLTGRIHLFLEDFTRRMDTQTVILHDTCLRQTNAIQVNYNTVIQEGGKIIRNELENLPKTLLGWSPEGLLSGTFRNRPAIIVATGPSLQKNIHLLRQAQGKTLIIAVAQALRVLLAYDVRPDIICSIDFGEPNYLEIKDAFAVADMPLLTSPQVHPQVPLEYQGDLFVTMDRNNLLCTPGSDLPPFLGHSLTVAQVALNLALMVGANPIIFTGQDLAFGESSHISGALASRPVTVRGNRVIAEHEQGDHEQAACWVPGYYGNHVLSNTSLFAFLEAIETTLRDHPDRRFINATEGGAHIAGTERMPLSEVLEMHCHQEFPVTEFLAKARIPLGSDPNRLYLELEESRRHLERLLRYVEKLEQMTGRMKTMLPGKGEKCLPQRINQLNGLNRQVLKSFASVLQTLDEGRLIRLATVRIRRDLIRIGEQSLDTNDAREIAVQAIRYCEELCSGLKDSCPPLMEKIDDVHPVLKEYASVAAALQTAAPGSDAEAGLHLRQGFCLRRMGDFVKAAVKLEAAARSEAFRTVAMEELFALHLDRNQFGKAGECLERLPDGHQAKQMFRERLQKKREEDQTRHIETARRCLEKNDFVGCLLECRILMMRHEPSGEVREIMEQALELREQKVLSTAQQVLKEQEEKTARDERKLRFETARQNLLKKDFSTALALFRELVESDPSDSEAGLGLLRTYEGAQSWEAAEKELLQMTNRHPENAMLYRDLGNVQLRRGKLEAALESYRNAVDRDPGSNGPCLQIAFALSSSGRTIEALPFYERYVKTHPNDYRILLQWADCFLRLGSSAAAKVGYEAALRIQPGYPPALERLQRLKQAATP